MQTITLNITFYSDHVYYLGATNISSRYSEGTSQDPSFWNNEGAVTWALNGTISYLNAQAGDIINISTSGSYNHTGIDWSPYAQYKITYNGVCVASCGATLASITLSPCPVSIVAGSTTTLTATCKDSTGATISCPSLTWSGSNQYASVNNGVITGNSAGTANITASASGITSNTCAVTITSSTSNNYGCTVQGQCQQGYGTLPPGCNNTCIPVTTSQCDPVACPANTNFCIAGNCVSKTIAFGALGLFILMMIMKK